VIRRPLLSALLLLISVATGPRVRAQGPFTGAWTLVSDSVSGHIPGLPPPPQLEIARSGDVIAVKKGQMPLEAYHADGSPSDLEGFRKGTLQVNDAQLTLTTTRVRPGSDVVTIVTDHYALNGDELLATRTLRVERQRGVLAGTPGGPIDTPQNRWVARYRRR
jgi:hypothetical protein